MNSSKSEDSVSPSHLSDRAAREKAPAGLSTPTYESATFSRPALDQFNGVLPEFNRRLSPDRDLGLSPAGQPRLSPETRPRLVSECSQGLVSGNRFGALSELKTEDLEFPAGKGLEVRPDLPGRTLRGDKFGTFSASADLPMGPVESKLMSLSSTEEKLKNAEKERK
ncbi:hypothetical protein FTO70_15970 [Methanosarcina sp. KYL-1]|uniref:hypothetical protein n=1 Tax=Methanosarcina sp. KYL-1 TaxID=2602068 RepID=UPI002100DAC3|nr:hypothetical protein [Methanosarcina sp. KYL-1]MCQ1537144.1 hypothetical protein [Methanosarcina sp. KYL-1]